MKQRHYAIISLLLLAGCAQGGSGEGQLKTVTPVDFSQVKIQDEFWSPRLDKHKSTTLKVCIDHWTNASAMHTVFPDRMAPSAMMPSAPDTPDSGSHQPVIIISFRFYFISKRIVITGFMMNLFKDIFLTVFINQV